MQVENEVLKVEETAVCSAESGSHVCRTATSVQCTGTHSAVLK